LIVAEIVKQADGAARVLHHAGLVVGHLDIIDLVFVQLLVLARKTNKTKQYLFSASTTAGGADAFLQGQQLLVGGCITESTRGCHPGNVASDEVHDEVSGLLVAASRSAGGCCWGVIPVVPDVKDEK